LSGGVRCHRMLGIRPRIRTEPIAHGDRSVRASGRRSIPREGAMAQRMVPVGFVLRALRASERRGHDLRPALVAAPITDRELGDPDARLTTDQVARFMVGAWEITGDELMGLGLTAVPRGTFRLLSFARIGCRDLDSVLGRLEGCLPALPSS